MRSAACSGDSFRRRTEKSGIVLGASIVKVKVIPLTPASPAPVASSETRSMRRHAVPPLFFGYGGSRTSPENPQRITVDADGLPTGLRGPHRSHVQDSRQ